MKTFYKSILLFSILHSSFFSFAQQFSVSQSGTWSTCTGTYTNLTDGNFSTGAGTSATSNEWIKASFASPQAVSSVGVAGGYLNSWGMVAQYYLNGATIQSSTDDVNWITQATISGVTDSNGLNNFSVGLVTAQYWRIAKNGWLATTEFVFNSTVTSITPNNPELTPNNQHLITNIYPNPASDYFQYTINSSVDSEAKLQLIDVLGRAVIEKNIKVVQGINNDKIDVSSISKGAYVLQVITKNGLYKNQQRVTVK